MKSINTRKALIILFALVGIICCVLAFTACGGSGDNGDAPPEVETPANTYTVIYDANGGKFGKGDIDLGNGETIDDGADISDDGKRLTEVTSSVTLTEPLRMPELSNNAFCGWAKDADGNELWDFENDELSGETTTLYAVWATTFDFILSDDLTHY